MNWKSGGCVKIIRCDEIDIEREIIARCDTEQLFHVFRSTAQTANSRKKFHRFHLLVILQADAQQSSHSRLNLLLQIGEYYRWLGIHRITRHRSFQIGCIGRSVSANNWRLVATAATHIRARLSTQRSSKRPCLGRTASSYRWQLLQLCIGDGLVNIATDKRIRVELFVWFHLGFYIISSVICIDSECLRIRQRTIAILWLYVAATATTFFHRSRRHRWMRISIVVVVFDAIQLNQSTIVCVDWACFDDDSITICHDIVIVCIESIDIAARDTRRKWENRMLIDFATERIRMSRRSQRTLMCDRVKCAVII